MKDRIKCEYHLFSIIILCMLVFMGCSSQKERATSLSSACWEPSIPEGQGVDSEILLNMMQKIEKENIQMRSIIVLRNQRLILEFYRFPYNRKITFNTKSASKSIISALTGIALREKWIDSLDRIVESYFPQYFTAGEDPLKTKITLRHILTMTSGLKIEEQSPEWDKIFAGAEPVRTTFAFPMAANPGEVFNYLTPMPLIMAAILTGTSGQSLEEISRRYLFEPLGITDAFWKAIDKRLIFSDIYMRPLDMAKFGMLFLQKGKWQGKQVLPEEWVKESTSLHVEKTNQPIGSYGYMWWIDPDKNIFKALGWGGQGIYVLPDKNAVIVITSSDYFASHKLVEDYIFPAIKSTTLLAPNPEKNRLLSKTVQRFASADFDCIRPIKRHPELAKKINNLTFNLEANPAGWLSMAFHFAEASCQLTLGTDEGTYTFNVGLDNVYRFSDAGRYGERPDHNKVALRGKWKETDTFFLDFLQLGRPEHAWIDVRFKENEIELKVELAGTGGFTIPMKGKRS
ncbi:serine hydrolase domain-containing protein [Acidobacteriota bacterium]